MIEFRCGNCNVKIRTPDEFAGRKGKCPKCGAYIVTPGPGGNGGATAAAPKPPPVTDKNELIQYKCTKCKSVLESPTSMAGRDDVCPACGTPNKVPYTKQQLEIIRREQELERRRAEELKEKEIAEHELQARMGSQIREKAEMGTPIMPEDFTAIPSTSSFEALKGSNPDAPAMDQLQASAPPSQPGQEQIEQESAASENLAEATEQQPHRRTTVPGQATASMLGFFFLIAGLAAIVGGGAMIVLVFVNRQKVMLAQGGELHQTPMEAFLTTDMGLIAGCGLTLAGLIMAGLGRLYLFAKNIAQFRPQ